MSKDLLIELQVFILCRRITLKNQVILMKIYINCVDFKNFMKLPNK